MEAKIYNLDKEAEQRLLSIMASAKCGKPKQFYT